MSNNAVIYFGYDPMKKGVHVRRNDTDLFFADEHLAANPDIHPLLDELQRDGVRMESSMYGSIYYVAGHEPVWWQLQAAHAKIERWCND